MAIYFYAGETYDIIDSMVGSCYVFGGTTTFDAARGEQWLIRTSGLTFSNIKWGTFVIIQPDPCIVYLNNCDISDDVSYSFYPYARDYYYYNRFDLSLTVQDKNGTAIEGATVVIKDKNGDEVTGSPFTTDEDGLITASNILYRIYQQTGAEQEEETIYYSPHTVTISKAGYITKRIKYTMDQKRIEVETLEKVKDYNFSRKAKIVTQ